MNLDDLLKNVFPQEVNQSAPMELQQQKKSGGDLRRQGTLGEMTLEDFLLKAGVVAAEVSEEGRSDQGTLGFATWSPWMQQQNQQSGMRDYAPSRSVPQVMGMGLVAGYSEGRQVNASSPLLGTGSDPSSSGGKRLALEHVAEKTVERRKKRMIKNRESAARSRARKQARLSPLLAKFSQGQITKWPPQLTHNYILFYIF
ncbi:Abscisic acid-insensitive 5-like protein 2 [Apostasia shenzhenica]|uniref:Abscisic acid-insensitive 5-like protein 2 n=1 Tax=Apostasia shenzhenica TaxID=1088818 RepID=A0A2I0BCV9_9ASPA|nr:Abscisic acid-insensitive 5-like protein 2 [Apostasia shenzhenica]